MIALLIPTISQKLESQSSSSTFSIYSSSAYETNSGLPSVAWRLDMVSAKILIGSIPESYLWCSRRLMHHHYLAFRSHFPSSLFTSLCCIFLRNHALRKFITLARSLFAPGDWTTLDCLPTVYALNPAPEFYTFGIQRFQHRRDLLYRIIGISCLLFLYKIFVTIRRRRTIGFRYFGPLQILFITFGQYLILPRTFIFYFLNLIIL